jgi:UDP-N-acetylglucosamine--N-acetylmuramyl-(pentapeptide) pyrophosphoryl-undecaprenol N-acetylglucosamine transferase
MLVVLSGGGTAGHINPALALAEVLESSGNQVLFAGTKTGVEARLVEAAGIPFTSFEATGFNRAHPLTLISACARLLKSTRKAKTWLKSVKPHVVVCFGGYVSLAVGRACKSLSIPLVIHEQNSVMGLANKYLAKSAARVCLTYPQAQGALKDKSKVTLTGNPVRASIRNATRSSGRAFLEISDKERLLLVFGGSLGARHINSALASIKDELLGRENFTIVHLTGPKELENVVQQLALSKEEQRRWRLFGYSDNMAELLAAADVVLARSGASSLAEISSQGVPALLVPFAYATGDHQSMNAKAYVESGAAFMIADDKLDSHKFADLLFELIDNSELRKTMRRRAQSFKTLDAANRLAEVVGSCAKQ